MKVIYLKKTGNANRGEVKEVAEGYAQNFLIKSGAAAKATPELIKKIQSEIKNAAQLKVEAKNSSQILADKIRNRRIELVGKANEAGKLYAAVTAAEIRNELKRLGYDLGEAEIAAGHIKAPGEYRVSIDFGGRIRSEIIVIVRV